MRTEESGPRFCRFYWPAATRYPTILFDMAELPLNATASKLKLRIGDLSHQ